MTVVIISHHLSAILTISDAVLNLSQQDFISLLRNAALSANMQPMGEVSVEFQPQGISAVILLSESHVALHLWPEHKKICIDIHVCDYQENNLIKAQNLANLLTLKLSANNEQEKWHYLKIMG
ncbi:S-adenosylmethionine decarboxylase related protein [Crinalium epipsammum PCC 9333]|uniref:S-adenosylmethionine decarboxylase related protein n=1 Tax=Crinalium epipsammum PCC 9333 TaxID=1173022 RepID=K9W5N2_9CYAN|nr:S-adenosylmethionine decarboxylase [Crinalium epipsammum]AFZ15089.1 S-adenosylmethionine decarboxylase related protein [Crinalium epipsammum PCC 9333]